MVSPSRIFFSVILVLWHRRGQELISSRIHFIDKYVDYRQQYLKDLLNGALSLLQKASSIRIEELKTLDLFIPL